MQKIQEHQFEQYAGSISITKALSGIVNKKIVDLLVKEGKKEIIGKSYGIFNDRIGHKHYCVVARVWLLPEKDRPSIKIDAPEGVPVHVYPIAYQIEHVIIFDTCEEYYMIRGIHDKENSCSKSFNHN